MSDEEVQGLNEITVDANNLYREEVFTDLRVATIRRLTPIQADGSPDPNRQPLFSAQTHLMSQAGPLPVEAPLNATTLEEAIASFPTAIQEAVDKLIEEAKEMRRRESSRIVVPGGPLPGGGGGGLGGGGGGGIIG